MGQLLSAQATSQIPFLLNAFFVGDVLTKRDCLRLQSLAANCRIINMYGTTETQRAVSYFAVPPVAQDPTFLNLQKDIMPAGEGMIDVQLLVVNRNEKNVAVNILSLSNEDFIINNCRRSICITLSGKSCWNIQIIIFYDPIPLSYKATHTITPCRQTHSLFLALLPSPHPDNVF